MDAPPTRWTEDGWECILIDVYLRDLVTGRAAVYRTDHPLRELSDPEDTGEWYSYYWEDGNGGCDNNRAYHLASSLGLSPEPRDTHDARLMALLGPPHPDPNGHACEWIDEGRFIVDKIVRLDTGETVYSETEDAE